MRKLLVIVALAFAAPAAADEPRPQRQHEILRERPSGFWTSNRPAEGGRYRWRMLGIGAVLAGVMGLVILRTIRRANAERATSSSGSSNARS